VSGEQVSAHGQAMDNILDPVHGAPSVLEVGRLERLLVLLAAEPEPGEVGAVLLRYSATFCVNSLFDQDLSCSAEH
jgi:hypothetical protein